MLEMTKITLAGTQPNDPFLTNMFMYQSPNYFNRHSANERLSVNDCFLRNMQKYKYIANIDNDEVIVPQFVSTWSELMKEVEYKYRALTDKVFSQILAEWLLNICSFVDGLSRFLGLQNGSISGYHANNGKPIEDTFRPSHDAACVQKQDIRRRVKSEERIWG